MSGRWIVACACVAAAGCGSEQRLEPGTAGALREDVAAVRAAAEEGDRARALSGLESLRERIDQAEADGELDDRAAAELRRGVRRANRRVDQELAAAASPEPTATAEPPPAEPEEDADEEGNGEPGTGNDENKGKGEIEGKGKRGERGEGDD